MKKKEYYSIGIMSGTSLDGLDFSLIKTDGKLDITVIKNLYFSFNDTFIYKIKSLIDNFNNYNYEKIFKSNDFIEINKKFSEIIIEKTQIFLDFIDLEKTQIDVLGIHGITLLHSPKKQISIQLGDSELISKALQLKVISNFRINDIKNGGQGAPLVPIYHQSIFSKKNKNIIVVNIGGISNYTLMQGDNYLCASDIGPGNVLLDNFCSKFLNINYDDDGSFSAKGKIIISLIDKWLKKHFLRRKHPISFDNYFFKLEDYLSSKHDDYDILRTLTYFTALNIYNLRNKHNCIVDEWIFSGGGTKNKTLMMDINNLLSNNNNLIKHSDEEGFDSDFIESQAFAYISVRTLINLPSAFPETTGCKEQNICGEVFTF